MTLAPSWQRWLINRNYALFMAGSFVSALGSWFQTVAIGWLVLEITDSPFALGLVNFTLMAPLFFLGVAGGLLSDRMDRRSLLLGGLAVGTVGIVALAALAHTHVGGLPLILVACLTIGLSQSVVWPAWQPFIKDLVPIAELRKAIAFNSARFNLTRVGGPALAGLLMAQLGAPICLAIAAVSSAAVIVAVWLIRPPQQRASLAAPWRAAVGEGIHYLSQDRFTTRMMLITAGYGLVVQPYQAFMPAFARDVLRVGPEGLGMLLTAVGAGAVIGALASGGRFAAARPTGAMALFAAISGAGLAAFAVATPEHGLPPWVAVPLLAVVGLGSVGYLTAASSTLQLRVPDELVGRVMGLWVVVNAGTMPLGSLALGSLAERVGLPLVTAFCGVVGIALAGALASTTQGMAKPVSPDYTAPQAAFVAQPAIRP